MHFYSPNRVAVCIRFLSIDKVIKIIGYRIRGRVFHVVFPGVSPAPPWAARNNYGRRCKCLFYKQLQNPNTMLFINIYVDVYSEFKITSFPPRGYASACCKELAYKGVALLEIQFYCFRDSRVFACASRSVFMMEFLLKRALVLDW